MDRGSEKPPTRSLVGDLARRYKVLRHEGASNLSAVLNRGAAAAGETATHYLFLHDDIEAIASGWLQHMLGYAQRADVGIVGAMLLSPDETIQHAGAVIGLNGIVDHVLKRAPFRCSEQHRFGGPDGILLSSRDVSAVTDACLLVRRRCFRALAGFDEGLTVRYHELDLCLRTRELEYKVIQDAYAVLYHAENQVALAGSAAPDWCDLQRFLTRHTATVLAGDLFFSPALSKTSTDMALVSAAQASKRPRWRTTRVVLPGSSKRSQSFRLDTASRSRPVAQPTRASVSAVLPQKHPAVMVIVRPDSQRNTRSRPASPVMARGKKARIKQTGSRRHGQSRPPMRKQLVDRLGRGIDREMFLEVVPSAGGHSLPECGVVQRRTTASAKLSGRSAIIALSSWARYIPSAAIEVTTVGTPSDMLWLTFPLTPAPNRTARPRPGPIEDRPDVRHEAQNVDAGGASPTTSGVGTGPITWKTASGIALVSGERSPGQNTGQRRDWERDRIRQ